MLKKIVFTSVLFLLVGSTQTIAEIIDGEDLVDPTRPFSINDVDDSSLVQELIRTVVPASFDVSFIRAGSSSPMAVINQQRVTLGDVIGGAEVIEIDRNGVTLLIGEEERRVSLYDTNIKATSVRQQ